MSDDNNTPIEDHEYDGIQELDNPLPNWWLTTFFATIIFGFIYWIHYQIDGGQTQTQELEEDMARVEALKKKNPTVSDSEEDMLALLKDPQALAQGKEIYASKCAACHGPELQGLIGPNLTDSSWIHGTGKIVEISGLIRKGVLDKGMPAWEGLLKDAEVRVVSAYVVEHIGSSPPNPKPPQGVEVVR